MPLNRATNVPDSSLQTPYVTLSGIPTALGGSLSVPNRGTTPPASANIGDFFFNTTTNEVQVYTSNGWAVSGVKPNAPTNITVTSSTVPFGGSPGAVISWLPATSGLPASYYVVTTNTGGFSQTTNLNTATILGLTAGTAYTFTVTAVNDYGTSSATSGSVTPVTLPQPPAAVSVNMIDTTAYVTITAPSNTGGAAITSYSIYPSSGSSTATSANGLSGMTVVQNLPLGVAYTFAVYSNSAVGSSNVATLSSSVQAASIPVTSGLVGRYIPSSLSTSTNQWLDVSGNSNHAAVAGSPSVQLNSAAYGSTGTFQVVQGAYTDTIVWPTGILPSTYTLFYVARYNTSNSSTAATQLNYQSGSTTSGGMTPGTGGGSSITSVNNEWRMTYNGFETTDSIWAGEYTIIDNSSITANGDYLISFECRSDNAFLTNGTSNVSHVWDSSQYTYQYGDSPIMSTDRKFSQIWFRADSTFALGNRWVRGMNKTGITYGSSTYAYFRNWYAYRMAQTGCNQIFSGYDRAWYSGFWAGYAGSAYHGNTLVIANTHANNWVKATDSNTGGNGTLFRTNNVDRYNTSLPAYAGTTYARLSVNPTYAQASNFQIAEVIVFNRALSSAEYNSVETYLSGKYGV